MIKVIIEVLKLPFWSIPSNISPHFLQTLISHDQHPSAMLSSSTNHLAPELFKSATPCLTTRCGLPIYRFCIQNITFMIICNKSFPSLCRGYLALVLVVASILWIYGGIGTRFRRAAPSLPSTSMTAWSFPFITMVASINFDTIVSLFTLISVLIPPPEYLKMVESGSGL